MSKAFPLYRPPLWNKSPDEKPSQPQAKRKNKVNTTFYQREYPPCTIEEDRETTNFEIMRNYRRRASPSPVLSRPHVNARVNPPWHIPSEPSSSLHIPVGPAPSKLPANKENMVSTCLLILT